MTTIRTIAQEHGLPGDGPIAGRDGSRRGPRGRRRFCPGPLLRDAADLDEPSVRREEVRRVVTARVVFHDEALLVHDFPELSEARLAARHPEIAGATASERRAAVKRIQEDWLLRYAALISTAQAAATGVSTAIATGEAVQVHRPPRYGRAIVATAGDGASTRGAPRPCGLLDLKGAGVAPGKTPHPGPYGNGLCSLRRVLSDTFYQWVIDEIFARAEPTLFTVPIYGVLDLGFDVLGSPSSPAGMQIRRAHRRPRSAIELPVTGSVEDVLKLQVELLLRHYGLTSCTQTTAIHVQRKDGRVVVHHGTEPVEIGRREQERVSSLTRASPELRRFDGVNVQLAREVRLDPPSAQVLDFGQYSVKDRHEHPLASLVRDRRALLGRIVWPESPHYVQPDPRVRLSRAEHASTATSVWTDDLARRFREGSLSGDEVRAQLDARIDAATSAWGPA